MSFVVVKKNTSSERMVQCPNACGLCFKGTLTVFALVCLNGLTPEENVMLALVSEILDMAHEMARDLHEVGAMDNITMQKMDVLCLPPRRTFSAEDVQ